ncbi:MmcQ/YjbR family DNA-binding protein [Candidatus Blastococcus massiliensis]|uniref:MmcQ/YjbR family DNA-binding protein n=1 Tax=Candidatus Blastococcus massiliensis TaxID=1470358 RepID=UPI0004B8994D|nr:MmcQ/YjbR family DNA-binding protein [Candidatus Blastococcus massiliensis]
MTAGRVLLWRFSDVAKALAGEFRLSDPSSTMTAPRVRPRDGGRDDVDDELLAGVRAVALALPEAYEEPAWVGTRWRVRGRTFAHLLDIEDGRPQAHARAAGTSGPCEILTFRSSGLELETLRRTGPPFFAPPWRGDEVGLRLDDTVDWEEVAELVTDTYCLRAPKRLAAAVARPEVGPDGPP